MPSVSSRLALIVSTVLACGCVPIPHTVEVTPKIEGVLSSELRPVSGAEVRLTQNLSDVVCAKAEHITWATLGSPPPALIKLDCIVKASATPVTPQTTGREVDNLQICKSTRGT